VDRLDSRGVTLLFGPKRTSTFFSWDCLEGVVDYLKGRQWVPVGANRDLAGNPNTLDWYLKQHVPRQTANYVAVLLSHRWGAGTGRRQTGAREAVFGMAGLVERRSIRPAAERSTACARA
jgi:hypothetical protein